MRVISLIQLVLLAVALGGSLRLAASEAISLGGRDSSIEERCRAVVKALNPSGEAALGRSSPVAAALAERYKLEDLLPSSDPESSFLWKYPSMAMNAAQRHMALARSVGFQEVPDSRPGYPSKMVWKFFSGPSPLSPTRIVNQESSLEMIVNSWQQSASGSPKINVVMIVGAPGTGKSATLKVVRESFAKATLQNPEAFIHIPRFVKLREIEEVRKYLEKDGGAITVDELEEQIYVNPLSLVPEPIRVAMLNSVSPRVRALTGYDPGPDVRMIRPIAGIRDAILSHYAKKWNNGGSLSEAQEFAALNEHVEIRRLIVDDSNLPLINAQPKDVRMGPLFMSLHPLFGALHGPKDPRAYNYGLVLQGNGFGVFLEEFLKNEPYLTRVFLTFFQDRYISIDGAPATPWDGVIYVVTNPEELQKIIESDPGSPLLSRLKAPAMNHELFPEQILKIMLMNDPKVRVRRLGIEEAPWQTLSQVDIDEIIPRHSPSSPAVWPESSYALAIQEGDNLIRISPHAFPMLARVAALTRYEFDGRKLSMQYPEIVPNHARNATERLKAMEGNSAMTPNMLRQMHENSTSLNEGTFGLGGRELDKFWTALLAEAQKAGSEMTVTPQLIEDVVLRIMSEDEILKRQHDLRKKVTLFFQVVKTDLLLPSISSDLTKAAASSRKADIASEYWEFISEISERGQNPSATHYISLVDNTRRKVNKERYEGIVAAYRKTMDRPINPRDLASMFTGVNRLKPDWWKSEPRRSDIEKAVTLWLLGNEVQAQRPVMERILQAYKSGGESLATDEERAFYSAFLNYLEVHLGYSPAAAGAALEMWQALRDIE